VSVVGLVTVILIAGIPSLAIKVAVAMTLVAKTALSIVMAVIILFSWHTFVTVMSTLPTVSLQYGLVGHMAVVHFFLNVLLLPSWLCNILIFLFFSL
jgi:hypothetical protein